LNVDLILVEVQRHPARRARGERVHAIAAAALAGPSVEVSFVQSV